MFGDPSGHYRQEGDVTRGINSPSITININNGHLSTSASESLRHNSPPANSSVRARANNKVKKPIITPQMAAALNELNAKEGMPANVVSNTSEPDFNQLITPGNASSITTSAVETFFNSLAKIVPNSIRRLERPNNIGTGLWLKYINSEAVRAESMLGKIGKGAHLGGKIAIGIDVAYDAYENRDKGFKRIASDACVDTAVDGDGIAASLAVGAGLGTLGCPGIGTIIGGFVAGVGYIVLTDVIKPFNGRSFREDLKDNIYNLF